MTIVRRSAASDPELHVLDPQKDRVLQELERHGYVAEPNIAGSPDGTICRHPAAPSLLVSDYGRIELLGGQPDTQARMLSQPPRIRWGRGVLFLTLLCAATFLGLLLVAMIVG